MQYEDLTDLTSRLVCFDLPLLVQAFPDRRLAVLLQLSRWATQGKVIPLRVGGIPVRRLRRRHGPAVSSRAAAFFRREPRSSMPDDGWRR
jgi:hypothetical protein